MRFTQGEVYCSTHWCFVTIVLCCFGQKSTYPLEPWCLQNSALLHTCSTSERSPHPEHSPRRPGTASLRQTNKNKPNSFQPWPFFHCNQIDFPLQSVYVSSIHETALEISKRVQWSCESFVSALFWTLMKWGYTFPCFPFQHKWLKTIILFKALVLLTVWEKLGANQLFALL